ncbi:MAG: glycosyltransferase family 39 protein [Candidatus Gracilibacteria bacterium]|nr:glycosyltransferase family 39 protein [Candidatus Gracilibacteria bacterium]
MHKILLFLTFIIGTLVHIYFLQLNEILKVADSFAYLQMSNYFQESSINGFGNGWFGFLYSFPIAAINFFINNNFLSAQILNIVLFNFSGFLLYKIAKSYLKPQYLIILIILFFLSPILLHFNIAVLSENIYLPIFLLTVLGLQNYIQEPKISDGIAFAFLIALMYFTRGEAFIYLGAIGLISLFLYFKKVETHGMCLNNKKTHSNVSLENFISFNILLILFFGIFISPYIYYLHSFTGEWGLSNKGSSNLRQALLRGKEKMDDSGFEKAVAELTPDSKHLMAGFAGGLKYEKAYEEISLKIIY